VGAFLVEHFSDLLFQEAAVSEALREVDAYGVGDVGYGFRGADVFAVFGDAAE